MQSEGIGPTIALRRAGTRVRGQSVARAATRRPTGFVLEVEEESDARGRELVRRELFRADVSGDAIAQLSVYCTGDWDRSRRAQHAREVRLLRP